MGENPDNFIEQVKEHRVDVSNLIQQQYLDALLAQYDLAEGKANVQLIKSDILQLVTKIPVLAKIILHPKILKEIDKRLNDIERTLSIYFFVILMKYVMQAKEKQVDLSSFDERIAKARNAAFTASFTQLFENTKLRDDHPKEYCAIAISHLANAELYKFDTSPFTEKIVEVKALYRWITC